MVTLRVARLVLLCCQTRGSCRHWCGAVETDADVVFGNHIAGRQTAHGLDTIDAVTCDSVPAQGVVRGIAYGDTVGNVLSRTPWTPFISLAIVPAAPNC